MFKILQVNVAIGITSTFHSTDNFQEDSFIIHVVLIHMPEYLPHKLTGCKPSLESINHNEQNFTLVVPTRVNYLSLVTISATF